MLAFLDRSTVCSQETVGDPEQLLELGVSESVEDLTALGRTVDDQAALSELAKVPRDVRLGTTDDLDEIYDSALTIEQLAKDRHAGGFNKATKHLRGEFSRSCRRSGQGRKDTAGPTVRRPAHPVGTNPT